MSSPIGSLGWPSAGGLNYPVAQLRRGGQAEAPAPFTADGNQTQAPSQKGQGGSYPIFVKG